MDSNHALDAFAALSQPTRLDVFRLLITAGEAGMTAGDIGATLGVRQNTMSANLAILARAGLIRSKRDGRSIRYFSDIDGLRGLLAFLMEDCCGGRPDLCQPVINELACDCPQTPKGKDCINVLFLCSGNSARSIMAEAILTREGAGRFKAYSAGSRPGWAPHPYALDLLRGVGHDVGFARCKSWEEFAGARAPQMDFVFTVCDDAAAEQCPFWPGQPVTAHWGVPDPAQASGPEAAQREAFSGAYRVLRNRISNFVNLPIASLDRLALQRKLDEIGAAPVAADWSPCLESPT